MFTPLHSAATCTNHYTGGDYCCAAAEEHAYAALEAGEAVHCAGCGAIGDFKRYPIGDCFCEDCGHDGTTCECCGAPTTGNDKDGFLCLDETCPAAIEWHAANDNCIAD